MEKVEKKVAHEKKVSPDKKNQIFEIGSFKYLEGGGLPELAKNPCLKVLTSGTPPPSRIGEKSLFESPNTGTPPPSRIGEIPRVQ